MKPNVNIIYVNGEPKIARRVVRLINEPTTDKYELVKSKITDNFYTVVLSEEESTKYQFNPYKLANALNIKVEDAKLLTSWGKTYVFAEDKDGNIIELYHPSLDCNDLSISVRFDAGERYFEFLSRRDSFVYAPYAWEVGQTDNINHFVC